MNLTKSDILYKIPDNYQAITVYTTHGEADTQKVEIPTSKTVLSAAIYLTENKTLSHANITEYIASDEENTTDAATDGTATDAAQPTDGQQQADPNSADANATDANQQSDADYPEYRSGSRSGTDTAGNGSAAGSNTVDLAWDGLKFSVMKAPNIYLAG